MKNTTIALIVLIVIGVAGYFLFMNKEETMPTNTDTQSGEQAGAKIDIDAVCEGALAYMTFPSGEAAAEFVAECKAGNRPEVIEQYIRDNGLDGASI
jgi:hypothetical protein